MSSTLPAGSTHSQTPTMVGSPIDYDGMPQTSGTSKIAATGLATGTPAASGPPKWIPEAHLNRTVVLCFDGTGDQFDQDNSNIIQLFSMLKKDDRSKQIVYYQAGIGTYTSPTIATPLAAKISETIDAAIAWNIDAHVMSGYEFLMQNHDHGDRICIFGFSRGAYTARALAGMLHKVGLLPKDNYQQVPFAYRMYSQADEVGWQQSNAFKRAFSIDVDIEFVGVWDTVCSVGLIPKRLPFTTSNTVIRTFRHAVSLDERRAKFKANLWNKPDEKEETLGFHETSAAKFVPNVLPPPLATTVNNPGSVATASTIHKHPIKSNTGTFFTSVSDSISDSWHSNSRQPTLRELELKYAMDASKTTDVVEVWFSGCHCDVGGGSVPNGTPNTLARIPLRWMIREIFKTNTGIIFDAERLREVGLDPATLYPIVLPRPKALPVPSDMRVQTAASVKKAKTDLPTTMSAIAASPLTEEGHELLDAMSPVYDQLSLAWNWWTLEVLPVTQRYQKKDLTWQKYVAANLGRYRIIPNQKRVAFNVHRSVKMRLEAAKNEAEGKGYKPGPVWEVEPVWVD